MDEHISMWSIFCFAFVATCHVSQTLVVFKHNIRALFLILVSYFHRKDDSFIPKASTINGKTAFMHIKNQ